MLRLCEVCKSLEGVKLIHGVERLGSSYDLSVTHARCPSCVTRQDLCFHRQTKPLVALLASSLLLSALVGQVLDLKGSPVDKRSRL